MTTAARSPLPVRVLEGQGASERATRLLASYYTELGERLTGFTASDLSNTSPEDVTPPRGDFLLISELGSSSVLGFGGVHLPGVVLEDKPVADLQRMWLVPDARGRGLGHFLLRSLENRARALGARRIRLSLNHSLSEALALYAAAGYLPVEPFESSPFVDVYLGKDL